MGDLLCIIIYTLLSLLIIQGLFSLVEGIAFLRYVRRSLTKAPRNYSPKATLIVPCKGEDHELGSNLAAFLNQNYPDYSVIFAVASSTDPARPLIESVIRENRAVPSSVVVAAVSEGRSEKISNLLSAIAKAPAGSEVFVFADSDARVQPDWLASLIAPLADETVGAVTGYRWFVPERLGLWSALLAAWNGAIATTLGDHRRNFAWGGSTAIKKDTFERLGIADHWAVAVSDDYVLTKAVQSAGLYVRFQPRCLVASYPDPGLSRLLEFTTRQVIITRVYRPNVWRVGVISHSLFALGFFGGTVDAFLRHDRWSAVAIGIIYLLGSSKGLLRMIAASRALAHVRARVTRSWWMFCLLWPLVSLLFLYNFVASAMTRRITWRGVSYEMRSPVETIILRQPIPRLEHKRRNV